MAQVINTNISAINSQRQLNRSQLALQTSMERLSSGLRINSAKDDAAGLAISDRMTAQVRGLNQAVRNANDGISLAQVAEGALQESTNILQRMRELAVQSSNDSNSASDRTNLQKEINQLQSELNRIANTTTFNGKKLLDGSFNGQQFQVGAFANQSIQVTVGSAQTTAMGANTATNTDGAGFINALNNNSTSNAVGSGNITVNGPLGSGVNVAISAGDSAKTISDAINAVSSQTGVDARAVTYAKIDGLSGTGTFTMDLKGQNSTAVSISATVTNASDLTAIADAINSVAGTTNITAQLSSDKASVTLKNADGHDISIKNTHASLTFDMTGLQEDGSTASGAAGTVAVGTSGTVGGNVILESSKSFSAVDSAAGVKVFGTTSVASSLSAVSSVDIATQKGALDALAVVDGALSFIADTRADLGAIQNRFNSTISNLQNVSQNITAARSRIIDADFAEETANLSRSQILQQAGTAMLAQANASTQNVLSLLRG